MKSRFLISSLVMFFCVMLLKGHAQQYLYSNKKNISYLINDVRSNWIISPERNIDQLKVYCENNEDKKTVKFISDTDTILFYVKNNDTIRFSVVLNSVDTAITEIVAIHDLPDQISDKEKLYSLSLFWSESKYNFMNYDNLKFDWDSLYKSFIPRVLDTRNDFEFYRELKAFASQLSDGHTAIYDNSQFSFFCDYIPVLLTHVNKSIYIVGFRETLKEKLELGGEIVMIDGKPTEQYMEEDVFPYISASTEQNKWSIGVSALTYGFKSKPLTITYVKTNGKRKTVKLQRNGESKRYDKNGDEKYQIIGLRNKYKRNLDLTFLDDSIAVLNYSSFYPEKQTIEKFKRRIPELLKAKGLVIDMRNNRGGSTTVAYSLIERIIKKDYFLGLAAETRVNDAVYKAMGYGYEKYEDYYTNSMYRQETADTIVISDTTERFEYPIVILIGENTFSAAEDFLLMIYDIEGRPLLIGSPTAGSTGAPLVIEGFPGGGYARICARRCKYPYSGKQFVGEGIQPDITIYPAIEDVLNGTDVVLEKGIELVIEQINEE